MNMTTPKKQFRHFTLDNIGSAAVLATAVLFVVSGSFSAFSEPTVSSMQVARQSQGQVRAVLAARPVSPAPQQVLATPTTSQPMIIASNW